MGLIADGLHEMLDDFTTCLENLMLFVPPGQEWLIVSPCYLLVPVRSVGTHLPSTPPLVQGKVLTVHSKPPSPSYASCSYAMCRHVIPMCLRLLLQALNLGDLMAPKKYLGKPHRSFGCG